MISNQRFKNIYTFLPKTFKTVLAGILFSTLFLASEAEANELNEGELAFKYHVYAGEKYVGAVSDQEVVEDWIDTQKKELKKKFDVDNILVEEEIVIVPEQVFHENTNDEEVLSEIKKTASFQTEVKAVELNGKSVAYLSNDQEVEEMLRQIKLSAVSKEELETFEKQPTIDLPKLEMDQTRITAITVDGYKKAKDTQTSPANVVSPKEAAAMLLKGQRQDTSYKIVDGDTIESILDEHEMELSEFLSLNPELSEEEELIVGNEINVTKHFSGFKVNVEKEQRVEEEIQFEEKQVEDDELLKGETRIDEKGELGERVYTIQTSETDGKQTSQSNADEEVIKDPKTQVVVIGTKEIPSQGTGDFVWPTNGGYISSHQGERWGKQHKGIDIAQPDDYTINNVDNGKVVSAGMDGDYGNKVVIDHNNGLRTVYAHLSEIHVSPGQVVAQGESLGIMGDTGFSTGIHLHFEVYSDGALVNPMDYL